MQNWSSQLLFVLFPCPEACSGSLCGQLWNRVFASGQTVELTVIVDLKRIISYPWGFFFFYYCCFLSFFIFFNPIILAHSTVFSSALLHFEYPCIVEMFYSCLSYFPSENVKNIVGTSGLVCSLFYKLNLPPAIIITNWVFFLLLIHLEA